jgi:hypothetical protein
VPDCLVVLTGVENGKRIKNTRVLQRPYVRPRGK